MLYSTHSWICLQLKFALHKCPFIQDNLSKLKEEFISSTSAHYNYPQHLHWKQDESRYGDN